MDALRIPVRPLTMLLDIKQALMRDNDLSIKVAKCGKQVVADYIDRLVSSVMMLETYCDKYEGYFKIYREECEAYAELLCGLSTDQLTNEEKEQIKAFARTVIKKDEEDG